MQQKEDLVLIGPLSQSQTKSKQFIDSTHALLFDQIFAGTLQIPQQIKPLKIVKIKKQQQQILGREQPIGDMKKLKNIQQRKYMIRRQLEMIFSQQEYLEASRAQERMLNASRVKTQRSYAHPENDEKIQALVQSNKNLQKKLQQKTQDLYGKIAQQKDRQTKRKRKRQERVKQKRRKQIQINLNELVKRRKQQIQKQKNDAIALKEVYKKPKYHQKLQQNWKKQQNQQRSLRIQFLGELKRTKTLDIAEIKQHEKKYDEMLKSQRQQKMKLSLVTRSRSQESRFEYQYSNLFDLIQKQQEQKRLKQIKKKQQWKQLIQKRNKYNQQFRQKNKIVKSNSRKKQEKQNMNAQSVTNMIKPLNMQETYRKGLQYMRSVNSKLKKPNKEQQSLLPTIKTARYKNYLQQIRNTNESNSERGQVSEIKKIMNLKNIDERQKLQKACLLADKIQNRNYYTKSKVIVESIHAKLQILKDLR